MSWNSYETSKYISANDPPFDALIMALIRKADTNNSEKIKQAWPEIWAEFWARFNTSGGVLESDGSLEYNLKLKEIQEVICPLCNKSISRKWIARHLKFSCLERNG